NRRDWPVCGELAGDQGDGRAASDSGVARRCGDCHAGRVRLERTWRGDAKGGGYVRFLAGSVWVGKIRATDVVFVRVADVFARAAFSFFGVDRIRGVRQISSLV